MCIRDRYMPYVEQKTTDLIVTKHISFPQGYVYDGEDKMCIRDRYYVGQNDKYHVEKTNDFSLKYQIEFLSLIHIWHYLVAVCVLPSFI